VRLVLPRRVRSGLALRRRVLALPVQAQARALVCSVRARLNSRQRKRQRQQRRQAREPGQQRPQQRVRLRWLVLRHPLPAGC
jgi:hypothetical protein